MQRSDVVALALAQRGLGGQGEGGLLLVDHIQRLADVPFLAHFDRHGRREAQPSAKLIQSLLVALDVLGETGRGKIAERTGQGADLGGCFDEFVVTVGARKGRERRRARGE